MHSHRRRIAAFASSTHRCVRIVDASLRSHRRRAIAASMHAAHAMQPVPRVDCAMRCDAQAARARCARLAGRIDAADAASMR
jgi:hypothetical protein